MFITQGRLPSAQSSSSIMVPGRADLLHNQFKVGLGIDDPEAQ
jgi:hypothetical protein